MEKLAQLLSKRRTARNGEPEISSELITDLGKDQPVRHAELDHQRDGNRLPIRSQPCYLATHLNRPLEYFLLNGGSCRDVGLDLGIDFLVNSRHADEQRRLELLNVL